MRKLVLLATCLTAVPALASGAQATELPDLTASFIGWAAVGVFAFAYTFVILEEVLHLRKSKPVLVAAGIIWIFIGAEYASRGLTHAAETAVRHNILEFGELLLFLLAAMTFINTMDERGVFSSIRTWILDAGFSLRIVFWVTGVIAFFLSPIADNLTTALVMGAILMKVGEGNKKFISIGCINVVIAANAGGAFSPFGDITTLMVWQKGIIDFFGFFALVIPSAVNWLVPAIIMSFFVGKDSPAKVEGGDFDLKWGWWVVIIMFLATVACAVMFHSLLHLPPAVGMMFGLGCLMLFGYFIKRRDKKMHDESFGEDRFDIFERIKDAEWDTLLFFYGVILCVGGLSAMGFLGNVANFAYGDIGATGANIAVGVVSAVLDNIPVMFAVLAMNPEMKEGQWLLVTLTAGVGGSLLSVGSAAGVALMGAARGQYTFFGHLKWTWCIALGYAASIWVHFLVNGSKF